jgi:hypothetical protein
MMVRPKYQESDFIIFVDGIEMQLAYMPENQIISFKNKLF